MKSTQQRRPSPAPESLATKQKSSNGHAPSGTPAQDEAEHARIWEVFRRFGYLQADLDPLGQYLRNGSLPALALPGPIAEEARRRYCGTVGVEFMHISDEARRSWIAEHMERDAAAPDGARILNLLLRADLFEQVIQSRYLGTKRFSLEGVTALIPLLDAILHHSSELGVEKAVMAMSHRGRLNVLVNIVGRNPAEIFNKFEDTDPRSVLGSGDVKYHIGATGTYEAGDGRKVGMHLVSNPSHLEAVDPVAMGRTRAKQSRLGQKGQALDGQPKVLLIGIHGDAAFAGQGIWAETLNMGEIEGFTVGGSIHIIANNLIGFTAEPRESNSSRFSSDLAKRMDIPVFHVNAEDPDAVVRVGLMAADYRATFGADVVIDLIGYRRHGHSEVDDPTITQPLRYARIKNHPPLSELYAKRTGQDTTAAAQEVQSAFATAQAEAAGLSIPTLATLPEYWSPYVGGAWRPEYEVNTGVESTKIQELTDKLTSYPDGFHIHPKIKKLLEQRAEMGTGKRPLDFGMAEALAFGSLLVAGTRVRLTGQDSQRGTFNQRHSVLVDVENEARYLPLQHLSPEQAPFEAYNSLLSEAGVLGFEYGFSRDMPEALTLWEAQFGDFANGAQIIIDQFISSGEDKWGLLSGLVLLLPHGYEGQGPEHSSARIERYLQLAAHDNIQICQPSTAAQYFHMLRRQAMRRWRKPLIAFTPKSMLRHPEASSSLADLAQPHFLGVVPDTKVEQAARVLISTGKIGHELRVERDKRGDRTTALLSLDQLYPWPAEELAAQLERYSAAREIVWVQEEPANMGALFFVLPRLRELCGNKPVRSFKRSAAASPATGSGKAHELEQRTLIQLALGVPAKA